MRVGRGDRDAPGVERLRRLVVTVGLVTLILAAAPIAAAQPQDEGSAAQEEQDRGTGPRLVVRGLSGVVRPGDTLRVSGEVRNPGPALEGMRLEATLLRRSNHRLDLQQALDDPGADPARRVVGRAGVDLGPVPGGRSPVRLETPIAEVGLGALPDARAGVYPLHLELRQGDEVVDRVVTSLVAMPDLLGEPLRTALVVPLDSPLGTSADGSAVTDPLAGDLQEGGTLPELTAALADAPAVPLTVATSGAVLSAAEDAADGFTATDAAGAVVVTEEDPPARRAARMLDDVGEVLARPAVEHIALPFASADLVALVRAGQDDAAQQAMAQGAVTSAAATVDRPAPGVLLSPDHLDEATLDALAPGVDTVLLDAANLEGDPSNPAARTPQPVRRLPSPSGSTLTALVADPHLSRMLAGTFSPPEGTDPGGDARAAVRSEDDTLAAQRILAETAAVYFERPFASEVRGLLLTPPVRWELPGATLEALLTGLDEAPWLQPVTVLDLVEQVPVAEDPVALAYPEQARIRELPPEYLAEVEQSREAITSLATVLAASEEPEDADRLLRIATSVYYRGGRIEQGERLVEAVQSAASRVFDGVDIVPGPQFTLTSRSGDVPITVANEAEVAVRVLVQVESPRFAFAADRQEVVLAPGEQVPVVFLTEALTPGITAPIDVTITDVQGARVLSSGQVVVATRTDSVTALVVTAGAGLFLAGWWLRDVRRRRRQRTEVKAAA